MAAAPPFVAFTTSLREDSRALAGLATHYGTPEAGAVAAVARALAATRASGGGGGGGVHCSGLGKSGAVAARLAISLRSIGLRAAFVHGAEWAHGDLGGAGPGDAALLFSHSGKTAELVDAAARLRARGVAVFAVTGDSASALARAAAAGHLPAPAAGELLGAVPTRSIVAQEAVANAVLSAVVAETALSREAFRENHPGGAIGAAAAAAAVGAARG